MKKLVQRHPPAWYFRVPHDEFHYFIIFHYLIDFERLENLFSFFLFRLSGRQSVAILNQFDHMIVDTAVNLGQQSLAECKQTKGANWTVMSPLVGGALLWLF